MFNLVNSSSLKFQFPARWITPFYNSRDRARKMGKKKKNDEAGVERSLVNLLHLPAIGRGNV